MVVVLVVGVRWHFVNVGKKERAGVGAFQGRLLAGRAKRTLRLRRPPIGRRSALGPFPTNDLRGNVARLSFSFSSGRAPPATTEPEAPLHARDRRTAAGR